MNNINEDDLLDPGDLLCAFGVPTSSPTHTSKPQRPYADQPYAGYPNAYCRFSHTDAEATVTISYDPTRTARGELLIHTAYRYPDGTTERDPVRRIDIPTETVNFLRRLWDTLFDQASIAGHAQPRSVCIHIDLPEDPHALPDAPAELPTLVRTIAEAAATQLPARLSDTAPYTYALLEI